MVDGFQEHPARAAIQIVNRLSGLRVEHVNHQPHDRAWRIKLSGFLIRRVGKLLDQVLISLAEYVGLRVLVRERQP